MYRPRCPVFGFSWVVLAMVGLWAWGASPAAARDISWVELRPGMEFGFLSAGQSARSGSDRIACLRLDPVHLRFKVLAAPKGGTGHTARVWRIKSGALAVFNAGQYAADLSYLGLLVTGGKARGRLAARLGALFAAEPRDPTLPLARIIDLRYTPFPTAANPYREAAQSLMLVDRFGAVRVRKSPKVAHRTLVAEDDQGRIMVMVTEGGHTLWELADFLKRRQLGLREIMCMDGGGESQIDLKVGGFSYHQYGDPAESPDFPLPWPRPPLPVVLAVFPRVGGVKTEVR